MFRLRRFAASGVTVWITKWRPSKTSGNWLRAAGARLFHVRQLSYISADSGFLHARPRAPLIPSCSTHVEHRDVRVRSAGAPCLFFGLALFFASKASALGPLSGLAGRLRLELRCADLPGDWPLLTLPITPLGANPQRHSQPRLICSASRPSPARVALPCCQTTCAGLQMVIC